MDRGSLIKINGVCKRFGSKLVLDGINLEIKAGELLGIIGASGTGKTTLLKTIIGFIEQDSGEVLFNFNSFVKQTASQAQPRPSSFMRKQHRLFNKLFGFATQEASFYPKLTVEENLVYFASLYDLPKKEIAENIGSALELVNLSKDRHSLAENLSQGMKKRLDLACSIVHNPKIVLLDEPTADLDPGLRHQIWGLIKKINDSGVTVVVASHFLEELEPLCHRIALLADGKLAAVGSAAELSHLFAGSELIKLKSSPGNYNLLCQWLNHYFTDNITHFSAHNGELVIYAKNSSVMLNYIFSLAKYINEKISNIEVHKLNPGQISGWRGQL